MIRMYSKRLRLPTEVTVESRLPADKRATPVCSKGYDRLNDFRYYVSCKLIISTVNSTGI